MHRRVLLVIGLLVSAGLLLAACEGYFDRDDDVDDDTTVVEETPTPDADATPTPDDVDPTPPDDDVADLLGHGQEIYEVECMACHGPEGAGAESSGFRIPFLNQNGLVVADNPDPTISVLMTGRGGMPRFSGLSDEEVAAVVSYIRNAWDNEADPVNADQVTSVRSEIYDIEEEDEVIDEDDDDVEDDDVEEAEEDKSEEVVDDEDDDDGSNNVD
jgi:mono/diheme cytochrome c family protein